MLRHPPARRLAAALLPLLIGCGDHEDRILGPVDNTAAEEVFAWIWTFSTQDDSLRVYDAANGDLRAAFAASPHALFHEAIAMNGGEPSVWMGAGGSGYAFSGGFLMHGDHAHMELPAALGTIATGPGNTHLGISPAGDRIAWANDGDASFTLVESATLAATTLDHGSPHSAALLSADRLLATHMDESWARVIEIAENRVIAEIPIDTLAHGDAYHPPTEMAFVACLHGIEQIDMAQPALIGSLPYPGPGRCNFLLHSGENRFALGPVKLESGNADQLFLLDLAAPALTAVDLPGAALAWNRGEGNFSLAGNGLRAAISDLEAARVYLLEMDGDLPGDAGRITTIQVAAANMACALDYGGEHLWLLDRSSGEIHFYHLHDSGPVEESHFTLQGPADWIFATSLDPSIEIFRNY
jgi:hypothetical protein